MPGRLIPLVNGEIYHIYNRGIDLRPIFTDKNEYSRAIRTIDYYRFAELPVKYSRFLTIPVDLRNQIMSGLQKENQLLIDIFDYSLMPNHFHLLARQIKDNGISKFIGNFENSYTKFFNTKHERIGSLLLNQFKAVRIETEEQLLHVSRYIKINPLTSFVIKNYKDLGTYPWSSYGEYIKNSGEHICNTDVVLSSFKNQDKFNEFIFDQVAYQRELDKIKHLKFE